MHTVSHSPRRHSIQHGGDGGPRVAGPVAVTGLQALASLLAPRRFVGQSHYVLTKPHQLPDQKLYQSSLGQQPYLIPTYHYQLALSHRYQLYHVLTSFHQAFHSIYQLHYQRCRLPQIGGQL